MLRDEIKAMLELEKIRHIRISGQLLYKLILEQAEMQQLLYSRFRQSGGAHAALMTSNRKRIKPPHTQGRNRRDRTQQESKNGG
ncbi:hypothetical protein GN244_ATG09722 [Phytophthora infestans]|uniref:Uncharacterized protein n=1 Tax=Phytophthora infestans TaxID=4787 RepID=A0A833S1T1_PHYIN|nr:hypothetical protein GN244_ATG09722 [Phytophthora infestans]KAF4146807.1 hypothetical protein GN958_ATG04007 [Phytophthora infestans]